MNDPPKIPSHIKLVQEKLEWDAKQKENANSQYKEKAISQYVVITEIDIPFSKLVGFLVKLAIAAVPAGIIVGIFWMILAAVFFGGAMK